MGPHRRKHELAIDNLVAHPLWKFMQGVMTLFISFFIAVGTWYLSGVNAKLEKLWETQSTEIRYRERLEYRVDILENYRKDAEQRGNVIRDRLTQVETQNKIIEDRVSRQRTQQ